MARRIALAMVLVAGCSGSDAEVKGEGPAVEHLGVSDSPTTEAATSTTTTTAAPTTTTLPPTTAASTSTVLPTSTAPAPTSTAAVRTVETTAPLPAVPFPGGGAVTGGRASWYARGARTANGEAFEPDGFTAAHRTLAFGTRLNVCHAERCVQVRINDRGPAAWTGRVIDLSRGAFAAIAPLSAGVVDVTWTEAAA